MHQSSMMISQESAAADRADRAADHAIRVEAGAARAGHQELVEPQALADQPGDAVVRVGARLGAFVAAGALLQVEHQQALGVHEPLAEEVAERRHARACWRALAVGLEPLRAPTSVTAGLDVGELVEDRVEVLGADPHDVDVVERGAGAPVRTAGLGDRQQADLAEVLGRGPR